jgi:hypothetical protein
MGRIELFRACEFLPLASFEACQLRAERGVVRGFDLVRPRIPPVWAAGEFCHTPPVLLAMADAAPVTSIEEMNESCYDLSND